MCKLSYLPTVFEACQNANANCLLDNDDLILRYCSSPDKEMYGSLDDENNFIGGFLQGDPLHKPTWNTTPYRVVFATMQLQADTPMHKKFMDRL